MAFEETFTCVPLPAGVDGTKVRIAVLVSPRLGRTDGTASAPLSSWPDAQNWPDIDPAWTVVLTPDGGAPVTFTPDQVTEVGQGAYDAAAWHQLFGASMPTAPFQPVDRSAAPIESYPVATVRDAVKDLHVDVLKAARSEFPSVAFLESHPTFAALKESLTEGEASAPDPAPPADADIDLASAFRRTERWHGIRPGSVEPPPTVTSLSPSSGQSHGGNLVTITGSGFVGAVGVTFDGKPATDVVVVSPTTVTCRAADTKGGALNGQAGPVPVVVTTASGASDPVTYTYVLPPLAVVTGLTPNRTTGGSLAGIVVAGTDLGSVRRVAFQRPMGGGTVQSLGAVFSRLPSGQLSVDAPFVAGQADDDVEYFVVLNNDRGDSGHTPASEFTYWYDAGPA